MLYIKLIFYNISYLINFYMEPVPLLKCNTDFIFCQLGIDIFSFTTRKEDFCIVNFVQNPLFPFSLIYFSQIQSYIF